MELALGRFAREELERWAPGDPSVGAAAALDHYARLLESGPGALHPLRIAAGPAAAPSVTFEVPVEPRTAAALAREARRTGVTLEELGAHAVLVYLADIDRGIVAEPDAPPRAAVP